MDLQIRGNDITITDLIQSTAQRHSDRLDRLVTRVIDAKLELRRQPRRTGPDITIAQVTLQTGKQTLRAEERDKDPVRAVDAAMEKLERQVRRHHERKSDRFGRKPIAAGATELAETPAGDEGEVEGAIVRVKRFPVKPMDADEAIEQMELLGHDFFLFQNVEAKVVSLVYRRNDGSYGLLIPEPM